MDQKLFKFNLLPKRSESEIRLFEERDRSLLYATFVVFFASFIWLLSSLLLTQVVQPRLSKAQSDLTVLNQNIQQSELIKAKHGELVMKSQSLRPLLKRSINTELIFETAETLVANSGENIISRYDRESSGKFVFTIISKNFASITDLMTNARKNPTIEDIELRSSSYNTETDKVTNLIAVNIIGVGGE